jgi:hypothetical protein
MILVGFVIHAILALLGQQGMGPGPGTAHAISGGLCGSYLHYRVITIPAQSGLSADLSNYPVEVQGTYSYLATVANGGLVQNASGYDVGFFTDNTCGTKLAWQTEIWTAASGVVTYWVKLPTVSKTTSTTFVMAYDAGSVTTDQSNATGVWDANFKGVYHLPNGTTLTTLDSTSNAVNGSNHSTGAGAGKIDGDGVFTGSQSLGCSLGGSSYIRTSTPATTATTSVTLSAWVNTTLNSQEGQTVLYNGSDNSSNGYGMFVNQEGVTTGHMFVLYGAIAWWDTGTTVTAAAWHYMVLTINAAGTVGTAYLDGTSLGTHTFPSAANTPTLMTAIGCSDYASANREFYGSLDELRVSNSIRNADWIATDYASQNSPATFYSVGSQF